MKRIKHDLISVNVNQRVVEHETHLEYIREHEKAFSDFIVSIYLADCPKTHTAKRSIENIFIFVGRSALKSRIYLCFLGAFFQLALVTFLSILIKVNCLEVVECKATERR
jgi:hypothetical protein